MVSPWAPPCLHWALLSGAAALLAAQPANWEPCAHLQAPALSECSGIIASRRFPDVFWVHNDSGDKARVFAIDGRGALLLEVRIRGATNVDWEDIAIDAAGHLYIADTGNNDNKRRDLAIYVIDEPEPRAGPDSLLVVPVLQKIPFHFPEQRGFPDPQDRNYDCEALFWDSGKLYLLTKHRNDTRTVLYRLPLEGEQPRAAQRIGEHEIGSQVTAADMSADGKLLAVLSYQYIHLFSRPPDGENFLAGKSHRVLIEGRQCEGIAFDGDVLRFVNEQREIFCIRVQDLLARDSFMPAPPRIQAPRVQPRLDGRDAEWPAGGWLELCPEPAVANGKAPAPSVRLGWCPEGLLVYAAWRRDPSTQPPAGKTTTLLQLMAGRPGSAPRLEAGQGVWEASLAGESVEMRALRPHSGRRLESVYMRRTADELVLEALVPGESGALRAGNELGFNVIVFAPGGPKAGEWAWAGSSTTQPLDNPLLWGRVSLDP